MIIFTKVISGRGLAKIHVKCMYEEIEKKLNFQPYPGTMNLVSSRPFLLNDSFCLSIENGKRLFWPAEVNGLPVFVYRWSDAPLHVFEVLSDVKLKDRFCVRDGEPMFLYIDEKYVMSASILSIMAWYAIWWKRDAWSYKNESYYRLTRPWGKVLGATQLNRERYRIKQFFKEFSWTVLRYLRFP